MAKKYALVTGGTSGIGLELAKLLAKDKYNLILVARDEKRLQECAKTLCKEFSVHVQTIAIDLTDRESPQKIYDTAQKNEWEVDALVNNAGFGDFGFFHESSIDKVQSMMRVNIGALTLLTRFFLPDMVKRGRGRILNIASTAAFQPGPLMAVYYASKAYVLSFTEAIANEVADNGVIISALCPGPTESGFQKASAMEDSKLVQGKIMQPGPVAREGYKAWMKGKTVTVTGIKNRVMAASVRITPRKMLTKIVRQMQERVN